MTIYKVMRAGEWQALLDEGRTDGAPVDRSDGFVHLSTAEQLPTTLAKHFAGEDGLVLAAFDDGAMGEALKWETSRGGALFPHLYRGFALDEVSWSVALDRDADGTHRIPDRAT